MNIKNNVLILLGSNKGNRMSLLKRATQHIEKRTGQVIKKSSVYETAPWGFQSVSNFLNQVLLIETTLRPLELLHQLLQIEVELGRNRNSNQYESREIDIDILFYDQIRFASKDLQIPHPKILDRKFTLVPLIEIAGDFIHPEYNETIANLARKCKDTLKVEIFEPIEIVQ